MYVFIFVLIVRVLEYKHFISLFNLCLLCRRKTNEGVSFGFWCSDWMLGSCPEILCVGEDFALGCIDGCGPLDRGWVES